MFENYIKNNPHPYKEPEAHKEYIKKQQDEEKKKQELDELYKDDHLDQYTDKSQ